METSDRVRHFLDHHTVLLVEDNEDEVFLAQRAFSKAGVANPLQVVHDGQEALDYLEGLGKFADRTQHPFPLIIFLDLNLPRKSGLEVLEHIRRQPALQKLTVFILSSSTRPADIERAAELHANGYFIKPTQIEKFQELINDWYGLSRFQAFPGVG